MPCALIVQHVATTFMKQNAEMQIHARDLGTQSSPLVERATFNTSTAVLCNCFVYAKHRKTFCLSSWEDLGHPEGHQQLRSLPAVLDGTGVWPTPHCDDPASGAVSSLLGLTCDAVVELDSELKFVSESVQLATMLLHRPGASMQGRS